MHINGHGTTNTVNLLFKLWAAHLPSCPSLFWSIKIHLSINIRFSWKQYSVIFHPFLQGSGNGSRKSLEAAVYLCWIFLTSTFLFHQYVKRLHFFTSLSPPFFLPSLYNKRELIHLPFAPFQAWTFKLTYLSTFIYLLIECVCCNWIWRKLITCMNPVWLPSSPLPPPPTPP